MSSHTQRLRNRNDQESLQKAAKVGDELRSFFRQEGLATSDVQTVMRRMRELDADPRTEEQINANWPRTFDELRQKLGGDTAARQAIEKAAAFQGRFAAASLYVAEVARRAGANSDPQVLDVCVRYAK